MNKTSAVEVSIQAVLALDIPPSSEARAMSVLKTDRSDTITPRCIFFIIISYPHSMYNLVQYLCQISAFK